MSTPQVPQSPVNTPKKKSPLVWILAGCGVLLFVALLFASAFLWWGYHKAKGFAEKAINSNGMTQVPDLWSDVPRMDGMGKAQQVDMPTSLKILARPILDTMMRGLNDGKEAGQWDWTGFAVNGKTPTDVQNFYTAERMSEFGKWEQEGGCSGPPTGTNSGQISFCGFKKTEKSKTVGLIIVAADDQEHKAVSIFFIRQEGKEEQPNSPQPSAPEVPSSANTAVEGTPYQIDKRPVPGDLDLNILLPMNVGPYARANLRQVGASTAPATAKVDDGNPIYADYQSGDNKIFMELGVYSKPEDAQEALRTAAGDAAGGVFPDDPAFGAIGKEPSYLKVIQSDGAFFAWTRSGYYFSVQAPSESALDEFMQAFPY